MCVRVTAHSVVNLLSCSYSESFHHIVSWSAGKPISLQRLKSRVSLSPQASALPNHFSAFQNLSNRYLGQESSMLLSAILLIFP